MKKCGKMLLLLLSKMKMKKIITRKMKVIGPLWVQNLRKIGEEIAETKVRTESRTRAQKKGGNIRGVLRDLKNKRLLMRKKATVARQGTCLRL